MTSVEKARERSRRYYSANREVVLAKQRKRWALIHPPSQRKINLPASSPRQAYSRIRETNRRSQFKSRHGITREEFEVLIRKQRGLCALCNSPFTRSDWPVIDHDHRCCRNNKTCTKCRRGIIHHRCNVAIGLLGDDPKRLKKALEYLESWS